MRVLLGRFIWASHAEFKKYKHVKKIMIVLAKKIGSKRIIKWYVNSSRKYSYEKSEYVGLSVMYRSDIKEKYSKKLLEERIKLPFEGHEFFVPKYYDAWLTHIYGDYMKLPPIEQQVTHHTNKVYVEIIQ